MSFKSIITHNFADPTTWYQKSQKVIEEVHDSVSGSIQLHNTNIIDVEHGKITGEDKLQAYKIIITKDGIIQTDFSVNYADGTISNLDSGTFLVTYWYATCSTFTIGPDPGKIIEIERSKLIISSNIDFIETRVEIWVTDSNNPSSKMILPSETKVYKNFHDLLNRCDDIKIIPKYSLFSEDLFIYTFNYIRSIQLQYVGGAEIRVSLKDNVPMNGQYASISFTLVERNA